MIYKNNKKGVLKLISFMIIMIVLSAGLGSMLLAQNQVNTIRDNFYNTSVDNVTLARIHAHVNPIDVRDYTEAINICILCMIIVFFAYSLWSSYLNDINTFEGVFNFFLLILVLAITGYLGNVHTYIWTMPIFQGLTIQYSAITFYFTNVGKINLVLGVLICIVTLAPKINRQTNINVGRMG